jgi:glycogen debranching enzyme
MKDVIEVNNRFYILASDATSDDRSFVLKSGDTFGVFDHYGDIHPYGLGEQGLFHDGTRHLSLFDLRLEQGRPLFLNSAVEPGNDIFVADLSNPDFRSDDVLAPRGTIHLRRERFLWDAGLYERMYLENYSQHPVEVELTIAVDADFADIFEVRGTLRRKRGELAPVRHDAGRIVLSYVGLDGVQRSTRVGLEAPAPVTLAENRATTRIALPPREQVECRLEVLCEPGAKTAPFDKAAGAARTSWRNLDGASEVTSSAPAVAASLARARADVRLMLTATKYGLYPYAGVPWFSTPFGRDGIITAMEMLWVNPDIARGVLTFLANTQATKRDDANDAAPGKILHEMRSGEMAALGEIPFGKYYGTVDATPLFVWLAGMYYDATGDRALIETLWPNIEAALGWIDTDGDIDRDGFVEYQRRDKHGLVHQGWKDSQDSISHADGQLADPPIALCEVQGYVYAAKRAAATLAWLLGKGPLGDRLEREADTLAEEFDRRFWLEELGTYALALDRDKRPCAVRTSNPGHCLFSRIAKTKRVESVCTALMCDESFSGWGVRTLDTRESRYNPMSYHNGSVWPHDTAIVAAGLAAYGHKQEAARITKNLIELSATLHLSRLPELICGLPRVDERGPTLYPVACAPQAWAAGSVFLALSACLGMHIDGARRRVTFDHPVLPSTMPDLGIRGLRIGDTTADLTFVRHPENVSVIVNRRSGNPDVVVLK